MELVKKKTKGKREKTVEGGIEEDERAKVE